MAATQSDRCGYRLEAELTDEELSVDACDRPVWNDHDRCVWHAKVDGKTTQMLERARPEPGRNLDGAYLKGASLGGVDWFADTSLVYADLTDADVIAADFSNTNLMLAKLVNVDGINANFGGANLEGATFASADLRRANLEDTLINQTVFTNAHVGGDTQFGEAVVYERQSVEPELGDDHRLRAASWAYRQLQQLYHDNSLPELARRSYNREKDARRRLAWDRGDFAEAIKWEISRLVMGYGSSPARVLLTAFLLITAFAFLFPLTGGIQEIRDGGSITYTFENPGDAPAWWLGTVLFKSFYFSVVTFATLGYGDIQPIGAWARLLAGVETILGSLLSALLVFVLTRIVTW